MTKLLFKPLFAFSLSIFLFTGVASAQELVWDASFRTFFDNREYRSEHEISQTLFGARLAPEIGVRWNGNNSLMVGIDLLANFGAKPFSTGNEPIVYYQYQSPKYTAAAGIIPRSKVMGDYSGAFFADSVKYYDPNLSGLLLQYRGRKGYLEFGADWNSMITDEKREKFLLFSAGSFNLGPAYLGYHMSMYHHAGTYLEDGVVDNVLLYPHAGVDLAGITPLDIFSVRVGWLQAFQNDRKYVGEYVKPGGIQVELNIEKWKFGISNTLYAGQNLMPYWVAPGPDLDYGPGLYWGEAFYRTNSIYNRLEVYWAPVKNDRMNLRVSSIHHYDGSGWSWQQRIHFAVYLGQERIFRKIY